jgi:hypothetical protein
MNHPPAAAKVECPALPSFEELQEITARDGVDATTTFLYQAVLDSPQHGSFIKKIQSLSQEIRRYPPPADVELAIVPGAFYRENPRSGADGHVARAEAEHLGWRTHLIPIASTGSLRENAETIGQWLAEHSQTRFVLVSLSKGGSDLKMALAQPGAEYAFESVAVWINLCGLLDGTPLSDWLFSQQTGAWLLRLYFRLRRQDFSFVNELRRGRSAPLDFALRLPAHIQMINVVGFPLTQHLTNSMMKRCHRWLAPQGPNDGGLLLADVCSLPGLLYPIWEGDHYLRSGGDMRQLIGAILNFVGQELVACPSPRSTALAHK